MKEVNILSPLPCSNLYAFSGFNSPVQVNPLAFNKHQRAHTKHYFFILRLNLI
jgi:hypothetical protein